jgi:hypothetical protein
MHDSAWMVFIDETAVSTNMVCGVLRGASGCAGTTMTSHPKSVPQENLLKVRRGLTVAD